MAECPLESTAVASLPSFRQFLTAVAPFTEHATKRDVSPAKGGQSEAGKR